MSTRHFNQVQLADRWGMSPRTLENWRWKGRGPEFLKIGGKVMYDLNDIEAYEREQKRQQSSVDLAPSLLEDAT